MVEFGLLILLIIIIVVYTKTYETPCQGTIYLDNNATTIPPPEVKEEMSRWLGTGNPSNTNCPSHKLVKESKDFMFDYLDISPQHYDLVWTSGASESNALFIRSVVENYRINSKIGIKPHVVVSAIEHKSILNLLEMLEGMDAVDYTMVEPDIYGRVCGDAIMNALTSNTCLVSLMWANNEIGTINSIPAIALMCRRKRIPFHTDATQAIGKFNLPLANIDGLSMSFHKTYGPPGIGLLVVSKRMKIHSQIAGMQNGGIRGGTENVPGIAGAIAGIKYMQRDRIYKNIQLEAKRQLIIEELSKIWPVVPYDLQLQYRRPETINPVELVVLGSSPFNDVPGLPNTLSLSVVKHTELIGGEQFCNIKLKSDLYKEGAIVSIGSACNTSISAPSYVLMAIKAPFIVRCGTIRISLGDQNTVEEIKLFIQKLIKCIKMQI